MNNVEYEIKKLYDKYTKRCDKKKTKPMSYEDFEKIIWG